MVNYRTLCDLAEAKIEALRADGFTLSDRDVIAINALAWEVQSPSRRMSLSKGKPVRAGNMWLWPFTIHNKAWFFDCGRQFANPEYALAYALAHRDDDLYTVTEKQVDEWAKRLTCTIGELRTAVAIIIEADKQDEIPMKEADSVTIHELARSMMANHGGSIKMWEQEVSLQFVYDYIDTLSRQSEAENKPMAVERAEKALHYLTHRIRRRGKANGK